MPTSLTPCRAAQDALHARLRQARPDAVFTTDAPGLRAFYLAEYASNLVSTVPWDTIKPDFEEGAGHELDSDFLAPWASAVLVTNSLGAWNKAPSQLVIGDHVGFRGRMRFERRFPTGLGGTPPHLDWLGLAGDGLVAIESKCLEGICTPKRPRFQPSYTAGISDIQAASKWGQLIGSDLSSFWRLDVGQLVRHAFGLMAPGSRQLASDYLGVDVAENTPVTLVYTYLEPTNAGHPAWVQLRAELDALTNAVAGDPYVRFEHLAYPQLWDQWAGIADPPGWLHTHLAELDLRYTIDMPT